MNHKGVCRTAPATPRLLKTRQSSSVGSTLLNIYLDKVVKLVRGGSVIDGATLSSFTKDGSGT